MSIYDFFETVGYKACDFAPEEKRKQSQSYDAIDEGGTFIHFDNSVAGLHHRLNCNAGVIALLR